MLPAELEASVLEASVSVPIIATQIAVRQALLPLVMVKWLQIFATRWFPKYVSIPHGHFFVVNVFFITALIFKLMFHFFPAVVTSGAEINPLTDKLSACHELRAAIRRVSYWVPQW